MSGKLPKHTRNKVDHLTELPFEIIKCPSCKTEYYRMWIDRVENHCPKCLNQHMLESEDDEETNI